MAAAMIPLAVAAEAAAAPAVAAEASVLAPLAAEAAEAAVAALIGTEGMEGAKELANHIWSSFSTGNLSPSMILKNIKAGGKAIVAEPRKLIELGKKGVDIANVAIGSGEHLTGVIDKHAAEAVAKKEAELAKKEAETAKQHEKVFDDYYPAYDDYNPASGQSNYQFHEALANMGNDTGYGHYQSGALYGDLYSGDRHPSANPNNINYLQQQQQQQQQQYQQIPRQPRPTPKPKPAIKIGRVPVKKAKAPSNISKLTGLQRPTTTKSSKTLAYLQDKENIDPNRPSSLFSNLPKKNRDNPYNNSFHASLGGLSKVNYQKPYQPFIGGSPVFDD